MSWSKVPEADPQFPKWLKRQNLVHDFSRVIWRNDACGCSVMCLDGLIPKNRHVCADLQEDILKQETLPVRQSARQSLSE